MNIFKQFQDVHTQNDLLAGRIRLPMWGQMKSSWIEVFVALDGKCLARNTHIQDYLRYWGLWQWCRWQSFHKIGSCLPLAFKPFSSLHFSDNIRLTTDKIVKLDASKGFHANNLVLDNIGHLNTCNMDQNGEGVRCIAGPGLNPTANMANAPN